MRTVLGQRQVTSSYFIPAVQRAHNGKQTFGGSLGSSEVLRVGAQGTFAEWMMNL